MIYSNPVQDRLAIQSSNIIRQVNIYTLQGKLINQAQSNSNQAQLDVSTLKKGMYFLEIISRDKKKEVKKVVKQ